MEDKIIQIFIQGGAVGIAVYALYTMRQTLRDYNQVIANHLSHLDETMKNFTQVLGELKEAIRNHFQKNES